MQLNSMIIGTITISFMFVFAAVGYAGGGEMIPVGQPFVDFELEAEDGTGVSSADLEGRPFLLFFYPKASTPG
jgi:cytochrome oxidase Cu insertion factor (SCO1/SenC/PrrC family)